MYTTELWQPAITVAFAVKMILGDFGINLRIELSLEVQIFWHTFLEDKIIWRYKLHNNVKTSW